MAQPKHILITCEHGGNTIPARFRDLFTGFKPLLQSHRGFDVGALNLAKALATKFNAPLIASTTSRLLIDLNRSVGHPKLYSEATRHAPAELRRSILEQHYLTYRNRVEAHIAEAIAHGQQVMHIASHSFTPVLDGCVRNADIGLLYDPARPVEVDLCRRWQAQLKRFVPALKVRRNYPYSGTSDGFSAYLRRRFSAAVYAGIELEINQKHVLVGGRHWRALQQHLLQSLQQSLARMP